MKRSEIKREEERAYWLYIKLTDLKRKRHNKKLGLMKLTAVEEYEITLIDQYQDSYNTALMNLAVGYKLPIDKLKFVEIRFLNKHKELYRL